MEESYDVVLLDAMNHAHRGWWRCRDSRTGDGRENGVERGFMEGLDDLQRPYSDAQIVLAWDGEPVGQLAELPEYKAARAERHKGRPADWHPRCDALREALAHLYPTLHDPTDEADCEIARLVRHIADDARTLIVSTDGDLLMLLPSRVHVLRPGLRREHYRTEEFRAEYGFDPGRLVLHRALVGDRSDGIPGLPHFPRETAKQLAATFGTVDVLYRMLKSPARSPELARLTNTQRRKLLDGEDRVRSNARLVDLLSVGGAPCLHPPSGDFAPLRDLLRGRELEHLASGLEWEALVGNSNDRTLVRTVLWREGDEIGDAPGPAAQYLGPLCDRESDGPGQIPKTAASVIPSTSPGGIDLGPESRAIVHPDEGPPREAPATPGDGRAGVLRPASDPDSPTFDQPATVPDLHLVPAWKARLDRHKQDRVGTGEPVRIIPRAPGYYAEKITMVEDRAGAEAMLDFTRQRPVAFVGVDCEYRYSRPGVLIRKGRWCRRSRPNVGLHGLSSVSIGNQAA